MGGKWAGGGEGGLCLLRKIEMCESEERYSGLSILDPHALTTTFHAAPITLIFTATRLDHS